VWWFISIGIVYGIMWGILNINMTNPLNARGQFSAWVAALCAGQLFFNGNLKWYIRLVLIGTCFLWLYIDIGLGFSWLSGWLPLCCCVAGVTFLYSRKLLVLLLLAAVAFYFINHDSISADLNDESRVSGDTREVAWNHVLSTTKDHLIFGTGPAGYAFYYATYSSGFNFSHNNYLDILAQTGLVGFIIWITFWLAASYAAFRAYLVVPRGTVLHGLGAACLAITLSLFVTMVFGDWVTPFTYTQTLMGVDYTSWAWIFSGLSVALYYYCKSLNTGNVLEPVSSNHGA
jgi:O-antigen ligase